VNRQPSQRCIGPPWRYNTPWNALLAHSHLSW
jgi:hypothetical protein